MSMTDDQDAIRPFARQAQIIVGALIAGVSFFLAIAFFLDLGIKPRTAGPGAAGNPAAGQPTDSMPILTYTAVAFAAVVVPMSVIVPGLVTKQERIAIAAGKFPSAANSAATPGASPDTPISAVGRWSKAYLTQLIIGAAMIEGVAYFAGVAFLIEKNPIAMGVALLLVAGVVALFPTVNRIERWIEQQQEKLREDQLQAPFAS